MGVATIGLALAAGPALAQSSLNPGCRIVNRSPQPIREVRAAPAGIADWSTDTLGGKPIPPGEARDIRVVTETNCLFDVRATFADGTVQDRHQVDVCKHQDAGFDGGGSDRTMKGSGPAAP